MEEMRELKQYIQELLNTCTVAWQSLILGEERKGMALMVTIIGLLEGIISTQNANLVCFCYDSITFLLPRLLKAMEERNGIIIADILGYELRPILVDALRLS